MQILQLAVSLAAALASYRLLEQPIRSRRWLPGWPAALPMAMGAYGAVLAVTAATLALPAPGVGDLAARLQARVASSATTLPATAPATTLPASAPLRPRSAPSTVASPAPRPPARIGVFGDSTAIRTGMGLDAFGKDTGDFHVVVNAGRVGCGIELGGERRFDGKVFELSKFCGDFRQAWAEAVASTPIDVAVIQTGIWEIVDRRLPGDSAWRKVGDPVMDDEIRKEVRGVDQFWAARHVAVVWLRPPAPSYMERAPGSMERFTQLLQQAVTGDAEAATVPLDQFLAGLSAADQARLRPDGIHFSEDTAKIVADTWLGPQVTRVIERLRSAPPG